MNWSGVKTIVTYTQSTTPASPLPGETWLKDYSLYVRDSTNTSWVLAKEISISSRGYGYIVGGDQLIIDRITYPFDSGTASAVAAVSATQYGQAAFNSSVYGYAAGGYYFYAGVISSYVERLTFPCNSGTSISVGVLSISTNDPVGFNSSNYGFACCGYNSGYTCFSTISRLAFPFDSGTASSVGITTTSKMQPSSFNSSNYGFIINGSFINTAYFTNVDRILYPFNSGTATVTGLAILSRAQTAGFNSSQHGFCVGGSQQISTPVYHSQIERLAFPFDSGTTTFIGFLTRSVRLLNGMNSALYGYTIGGLIGSTSSFVERITFPFASGTASSVGILSRSTSRQACVDDTDFISQFI